MTNQLARWGLTRDSALLWWGRLVGAATLVTTGIFDPHLGGADPTALGMPVTLVHKIQAIAAVILFISAQLSKSGLPGKDDGARVDVSKLERRAGAAMLVLLLLPAHAAAQAMAIDSLTPALPTAGERSAADVASWATVIAGVVMDAKASWDAPDRLHALELQGARVGATYGAVFAAKLLVHRLRPCARSGCGIDNPQFSFFSGHTALAFSTLGGPRLSVALPLAVGTGGLRVAAGKHYLTDVLTGAAIGAAAGHWIR